MSLKVWSYDFPIKVVFLNHDNIDRASIFECEEAKASRAAGCAVSHDSAL
jgi:hypothetical protein